MVSLSNQVREKNPVELVDFYFAVFLKFVSCFIFQASFNFGGVFCGSGSTMPFRLNNKVCRKVVYSLTKYFTP
mgnify:CR=1 FL=1